MSRKRIALYSLTLLLLLLLGTGLYVYQNLTSIFAQQANQYLREYGVTTIDLEHVTRSENTLILSRLRLRGKYENTAFDATLGSVELGYNWTTLIAGKLQFVEISSLDLTIAQTRSDTDASTETFRLSDVLPLEAIDQLPAKSVQISQFNLNYRGPELPVLVATGNLELTDQLLLNIQTMLSGAEVTAALKAGIAGPAAELYLKTSIKDVEVANISTVLHPMPDSSWRWQAHGDIHYAPLLAWLDKLQMEPDSKLTPTALQDLLIKGTGTFSAEIIHSDQLYLDSSQNVSVIEQFAGALHFASDFTQLDYADFVAESSGKVNIDMAVAKGSVDITLEPTEFEGKLHSKYLALSQQSRDWLRWKQWIPVHWRNTEPLRLSFDGAGWSLQLKSAQLDVGNIESGIGLQVDDIGATLNSMNDDLLEITLKSRVSTHLRQQELPMVNLIYRHQGPLEASQVDLQLADTAGTIAAGFQGNINLAAGSGKYTLTAQSLNLAQFIGTTAPLLRKFGLLQSRLEIYSGSITLDSSGSVDNFKPVDRKQRSHLVAEKVSGLIDGYPFDGLSLAGDWSGTYHWKSERAFELSLATLNTGFDIQDIQARISLPKSTSITSPRVRIDNFSARMFGGQLLLPEPAPWDFEASSNELSLQAHDLQLAEIVALQEDGDIQAFGTLEGSLPATFIGGRITIENGYLRALPPGGSIKYSSSQTGKALASGNQQLQMTLDLLSDFQYEVLSSAIDLDNAGNLLLKLALAGHNPAWENGRQINFNINLEQNLDPLLQSLRLSDNLVDDIEDGLQ